jgi:periplasmic mercuric ion binding protein
MKKISLIISVLLLITLTGCSEEKPQPMVKKTVPQRTISNNTEIKASVQKIIKISVPTVVCESCAGNIESALKKHGGVIKSKVNIVKKYASVTYDPAITSPDNIRQVISNAGYDADNVKRNKNAYQKLDECCKIETNIHS